MTKLLQVAGLIAVLAQGMASSPVAAEIFWAPFNGKMAALAIDPQTWEAQVVMQGVGSDDVYISAVSTEPETGELWAFFYDYITGDYHLGVWALGAAKPTVVVSAGNLYVYSIEFSPAGALYVAGYDYSTSHYFVGTLDLTTGEATEIVSSTSSNEYFSALAFHPVDGTLYFSGRDCTSGTCHAFIDTLTVPDHLRDRAWESPTGTTYYVDDPLFDSAGNLVFGGYRSGFGYGYYRPTAQGADRVGEYPEYRGAFGTLTFFQSGLSPAASTDGCLPSATAGCLQGRRFRVEATYDATVFGGSAGPAKPNFESDQSIKFSFFNPANLEVFLKIVDGCSFNGHYWLFASGLTNAGVSLRVTDVVTQEIYTYDNPARQAFVPKLDIEALACN